MFKQVWQNFQAEDLWVLLILLLVFVRPAMDFTLPDTSDGGASAVTASAPSDTRFIKQGIDVSHYQGVIEWETVVKHTDLVFLKATDGITYQDPRFQDNASALASHTLPVGAYHFFEPNDDPVKQADNYLKIINGQGLTLRPVLDVEISRGKKPSEIVAGVRKWLEYVEQKTGCKPVIYSYGSFWDSYLGDAFNTYPFWLADYAKTATPPADRSNYQLWQYTQTGRIPGIQHATDQDRFSGDVSSFNQLMCTSVINSGSLPMTDKDN